MKIRSVEYAGTIAEPGGTPPGTLPQVAFSGRSNVGKSSLINTLLQRTRSKLAHVSGTPGKTRALNFYRVNDTFFLVDLPGYGYASVPESVREQWAELIEWYLGASGLVRGVVRALPRRALVPCREAGWPGGVAVRPLVDTRASAVVRRGLPPLAVEWDGIVRPAASP